MLSTEVGAAPAAAIDARQQIARALAAIVREQLPDAAASAVVVERPRDAAHGDYATEVDDDGVDERRRASIEAIEERVRLLNGRLSIESREEGGTAIRVVMPAYVAAAQG